MLKYSFVFGLPALAVGDGPGFGAKELFVWLGILSFLLFLYNQASEAWRNKTEGLKEVPTPRGTYQTIEMCKVLHEQTEQAQKKTIEDFNARLTGLSNKVTSQGNEMNSGFQRVLRAVGRLEGKHASDD